MENQYEVPLDPNFCAIGMLTDKSSSMSSMGVPKIVSGCNEFLDHQRQLDEQNNSRTKIFFGTFSSEYRMVHDGVDLIDMPKITEEDVYPRGMTAMYDAIHSFMNDIGDRLTSMNPRPGKVVIFILTDGEENCSKEYCGETGRKSVFDKIKHQEETYNWSFYYAGANQDAMHVGRSLGISADTCLGYEYSGGGITTALRSCSHAVGRTRVGDDATFTEEERLTSLAPPDLVSDDEYESFPVSSSKYESFPVSNSNGPSTQEPSMLCCNNNGGLPQREDLYGYEEIVLDENL